MTKQCQWHPKRDKGKKAGIGTVTSFKYLGAVVSNDGS